MQNLYNYKFKSENFREISFNKVFFMQRTAYDAESTLNGMGF